MQRLAYGVLCVAAKKFTEHLVVEAGVDTESLIKPEIPGELISLLQTPLDHGITEPDEKTGHVRSASVDSYSPPY